MLVTAAPSSLEGVEGLGPCCRAGAAPGGPPIGPGSHLRWCGQGDRISACWLVPAGTAGGALRANPW